MEDNNMKSLQLTVFQVLTEKQQIIDELEKELHLWQQMVIQKEKELQNKRKHQQNKKGNGIQKKSKCEVQECRVQKNQLKPQNNQKDLSSQHLAQSKLNKNVSFGLDGQFMEQKKVKKGHE